MAVAGIAACELRRARVPLAQPFRAPWGVQDHRDVVLVRALGADGDGWGECVATNDPLYTSEYSAGAVAVLRDYLVPLLLKADVDGAGAVAHALAPVRGHPMAKAALETAVLDAELRAEGRSLADRLGACRGRVPAGVAVGLAPSIGALVTEVGGYVDEGYQRVKLKIEPGWDIEPVSAVRRRFGPELALQVDANGAYGLADAEHLAGLDRFGLAMIEQPLPADDLAGLAALASRLATPICLDESITSAAVARRAILMGAAAVINIKPGRVGGLLEAGRVHDVCVDAGVPAWCGGMLETGIGRAANLAVAALPGCLLPGDLSASRRYFHRDITEPFELLDGCLEVPSGPGIGVVPLTEVLDELTESVELVRR